MATPRILTARDIMTSPGIVVNPEMSVFTAIPILIKNNITGCPVTTPDGMLLGILSELDCMKIALDAGYHGNMGGPVSEYMSAGVKTVDADMSIDSPLDVRPAPDTLSLPVVYEGISIS